MYGFCRTSWDEEGGRAGPGRGAVDGASLPLGKRLVGDSLVPNAHLVRGLHTWSEACTPGQRLAHLHSQRCYPREPRRGSGLGVQQHTAGCTSAVRPHSGMFLSLPKEGEAGTCSSAGTSRAFSEINQKEKDKP